MKMTPGQRLQHRIKRAGLSQEKVAKAFGLTQAAISEFVVGGSGTLRKMNEIASFLGTTYDWIMYEKGPEEAESAQEKTPKICNAATVEEVLNIFRDWPDEKKEIFKFGLSLQEKNQGRRSKEKKGD